VIITKIKPYSAETLNPGYQKQQTAFVLEKDTLFTYGSRVWFR